MVKSDTGRSVHDDTQKYDSEPVDDTGLDSGGFDSNPKQVPGTEDISLDKSGYGLRNRDYSHGNFGSFGPEDEVFEVFSAVMNAPVEELEQDPRVMTDGGGPYEDEEAYTDGGHKTMVEVDHTGPYGDDEGGAPW